MIEYSVELAEASHALRDIRSAADESRACTIGDVAALLLIVEEFINSVCLRLERGSRKFRTPINQISKWKTRHEILDLHRIEWNRETLEGLVNVRNAVVHGGGLFTEIQLKNRHATRTSIQRLGIPASANRVSLQDVRLERFALHCATIVTEVDASSRAMLTHYALSGGSTRPAAERQVRVARR